ncbi:MAG: helix-turn-helix transcriptional regulator [Lachnospiraceae bacterium]|nr:helix-turn-helix transcriptional regulator [Lachnospiraceae bacterium]
MKSIDYTAMGGRIRNARLDAGLSQSELAEKCNLSVSFLGHIERGSRKMSLETLVTVCEVLNLSADYLLQDELPGSDAVIGNIIASVKKQGSYQYDRYVTIIKALAEISDKL